MCIGRAVKFSEYSSSFPLGPLLAPLRAKITCCSFAVNVGFRFMSDSFVKQTQISCKEIYPLGLCAICSASVETICENKFTFRHKGDASQ